MTNRRTFLAAAGAAVSCMALPLAAVSSTLRPGAAPSAAPAVGGRGTAAVEQWLLGKGGPTLTAADLNFIRSSQHPGRAGVESCDAR